MQHKLVNSSWGKPTQIVNTRVLRSYQQILARLANIGEVVYYLLLIVFLATSISLLAFTNLENIIFYDGTANTCILDGSTQEVFHVR